MKKKVLDITDYKCPITFIKAREFIQNNCEIQKIILIKGKKDCEKLKSSLEKNFQIKTEKLDKDIFKLIFT